ncbi:uncharacterized protein LOC130518575 [Takifugu flavidus]|uniref:uncharacterized protein LOC130518575 n=1 Tax=Takifugu flavidus TaxID=433684 RepID=UPI00254458EE|nr:uncharacterized protein LOC130518575 [Takifugu flavidus]
MAGFRVNFLLTVLTESLLLVSVRAWEPIDDNKLRSFYETGEWTDPQYIKLPDDLNSDYEEVDFFSSEDAFSEVEGIATVSFDSSVQNGLQIIDEDSDHLSVTDEMEGGSPTGFPQKWSGKSSQTSDLDVVCTKYGFQVTFLMCPLSEVKVLGPKELLPVVDAPASCGYELNIPENVLIVPLTGCHVKHLATCNASTYSLQFLYINKFGQHKIATAICEEEIQLSPRTGGNQGKCPRDPAGAPAAPPPAGALPIPNLNACTQDQYFVFSIEHNSASIPVDTTKLFVPGHPECRPIFVNSTVAIFKFKVTSCGTRTYDVGDIKVYLAQVQTAVSALNLKYGIITRSHPLRFLVECRYSKLGGVSVAMTTAEFRVRMDSSPIPSVIFSNGVYAVELRIATDETYTSYLPTNSLPLERLLGTKVYLELNLLSPYPEAVLIVNYCIAYPRSARNALVFIYKGCTNPYDPYVYIHMTVQRHQRRVAIVAFQFMEQRTNLYLKEEIIFMCSTEVCIPREKHCDGGCFDMKVTS